MREWAPVSTAAFVTFAAGVALLALVVRATGGFVPVLDHANLAFHEAGHLVFGILGETAGLYGGTLGQLVFPAVVMGVFAWRRQPLGVAIGAVWLGENLFNIARYVADARAGELPLVGGGEHDWEMILGRWRALEKDLKIAKGIRVVGVAVGLAAIGWMGWQWRKSAAEQRK